MLRAAVLIAALALAAPAVAATPLHQVQCIGPAKGCARGYAVSEPSGVVVSADGRNVYVRNGVGSLGTLGVFARNGASGKLTQIQCVARNARPCIDGRGLETPAAIAQSPDGRSVYVAARNGRSVGIYARVAHGNLSAAGSVTGLAHPTALAVSPDGRFVYVGGDRLWIFSRAPSGALTPAATVAQPATALALAGDTLYVGARGAVVAYARDAATGALTESARVSLAAPTQLVVAHGSVYAISGSSVVRYDPTLEETSRAGGMPLAFGLAVTDRVYVAYRDGVAGFALDLTPGPRTAIRHAAGVAVYGRFVYAVSPARITVLSR